MHSSTPPLPSGMPLSKESYKSTKAGRQNANSNLGNLFGGNSTSNNGVGGGPSPNTGMFPNAKSQSKVS